MGTLHLFGDSFTEGHLLDITLPSYKEWKKYRGGELAANPGTSNHGNGRAADSLKTSSN